LERQERKDKKKRMDKDDEEKLMEFVEKQVERGKKGDEEDEMPQATEFVRTDEDEKISLQLKLAPKPSISAVPLPKLLIKLESKDDDLKSMKSMKSFKSDDGKRKLSGLEEAMLEDMAMKKRKIKEERVDRVERVDEVEEDSWLMEVKLFDTFCSF